MITVTDTKTGVIYDELYVGDTFICGGEYFIKIGGINANGFTYNAVRLTDGTLFTIKDSESVLEFNADLVIK